MMENSLDHKMKSRVKIVVIFLLLSSMSIATIGDLCQLGVDAGQFILEGMKASENLFAEEIMIDHNIST